MAMGLDPGWGDDVVSVTSTPYRKDARVTDWNDSEAAAMKAAQASWAPLHQRLKEDAESEPDLGRRAVLAKMLLDVAMASNNPAVVGKQLAQLAKIYGHETTTIRHQDDSGGLEKRLDDWLQLAKKRQMSLSAPAEVKQIEVRVVEPAKDEPDGGF
ncbi:MAG: hypothetical protein FJZ00_01870 [Candidatus Sericytochromatia bacterium]|uniref:Uncharacterized protein n=1 Tax=Candidatus Tanganyikabacteria bacterium TaxID=2961651 RepID=A0A938BHZ1_9BACT|nr:hypothetical protein [Candidatus Tanganyikabacteria bacterium]